MLRRSFLVTWMAIAAPVWAAAAMVRGRLRQAADQPPAIITGGGTVVLLEGDDLTVAVLRDARLKDMDFEAEGSQAGAKFMINPIHEKALFVWKNGKRLAVTYWCAVCAIRSYSPGKCQCCQDEMALDLRDPNLKETDPSM